MIALGPETELFDLLKPAAEPAPFLPRPAAASPSSWWCRNAVIAAIIAFIARDATVIVALAPRGPKAEIDDDKAAKIGPKVGT
ncbi:MULTISPECIES: hypothetical protein [unclassified Bradyrhizobium]|uniref:hypothetical protein n=1 Tax=unclassified Bradyrhizobium TaxID=2631580 RepID=UPI00247A1044|nr:MULTISPECIES: hypothetical protein [unclassified Bradyrhizobium]WGS19230.1 hypothetical protein MTX22_33150 [Bradyrhizobium sp. ISRA463]WGS26067.1 hypothetical protein MTX19_30675 [Bradyrhizobium sp. ISRA464]